MSTQSESLAPAAEDVASPKPRRLVGKRLRQLRRITLIFAGCVATAVAVLTLWWVTSLIGLPDIGDPFDVAAFHAFHVPDDQNAFTYIRRARGKLTPLAELVDRPIPEDPRFSWSTADQKLREWAGANDEALRLFFEAAEQPDAAHEAGDPARDLDPEDLARLVFLEARRRQERGDTAGAWECHRAVLRMVSHYGRRGSTYLRFSAKATNRALRRRLGDWAADPRTTVPQLHAALDEVLKNEPQPDWDVSAIKSGYLEFMRAVEQPMPLSAQQEIEGEWGLGGMTFSAATIDRLEAARRFLLREPERSRRVLRLLCASYLARAESREQTPRRPAAWARFSYVASTNPLTKGTMIVPLYPVSASAPAGARALAPQKLAAWFASTLDVRLRLLAEHGRDWPWPPERALDTRTTSFRRAYHGLVIMLATELYRRERGRLPESDEALVGTYLDRMPDAGSIDFNDGSVPIIE
jgi:hypothetical protein